MNLTSLHQEPLNSVPKNIVTCKCDTCGKLLERKNYKLNSKSGKYYCGDFCARSSKRNGEYRKCAQCNKTFYTPMSKNKVNCSKKCAGKSLIDNPIKNFIGSADNKGTKNGQYKTGKYVGKGNAGGDHNKLKVRKAVIELDGHFCFLCGKPGAGLHLHRVIYGSQGGKYEVDNCVQLCGKDHAKVHESKKTWLPVLLSHIKSRSSMVNRFPD